MTITHPEPLNDNIIRRDEYVPFHKKTTKNRLWSVHVMVLWYRVIYRNTEKSSTDIQGQRKIPCVQTDNFINRWEFQIPETWYLFNIGVGVSV